MMFMALSLILFWSSPAQPIEQESLQDTSRFTECINSWVAFPSDPGENRHLYGFIYLDEQAGLTLHLYGAFRIDERGMAEKIDEDVMEKVGSVKVRLSKNNRAAILSPERLRQLDLPEVPDWLRYYDDGSNSVHHRVQLAFWLNHLGDSRRALPHLESAYEEEPDADGLIFELAFAYNALGLHEKAIPILSQALSQDPKNVSLGTELAYSYLASGKLQDAIDTYLSFFESCPEGHARRLDIALNLTSAYTQLGDLEDAQKWKAVADEIRRAKAAAKNQE